MRIQELLEQIEYIDFIGDARMEVSRFISFDAGNTDQEALMWWNGKDQGRLAQLRKGTVIVPEFDRALVKPSCNYIVVENPRDCFRTVLKNWFAPPRKTGIDPAAQIHSGVPIGREAFVGAHVVIEEGCSIGDYCTIGPNTVIRSRTVIGDGVVIGANCTIGGDGFGYEKNAEGIYEQIPHLGGVVIAEGVEIGNNTCIDRGVLDNTVIGPYVRIDNLVHIAHGVHIGRHTLVIARAMIGGSCRIGENVWIAPGACILNQLQVGDRAVIGLGAVVIRDVEAGEVIVGNPGRVIRKNS